MDKKSKAKQKIIPVEEKRKNDKELLRSKFVSPADFKYLTPKEKKKWVLFAVLIPDMRQRLASEQYLYPTHNKKKESKNAVEPIEFDLTDLFVEELKDEKFPAKNRVFQLFSACVDFKSDKPGRLYGCIEAKATGWLDYVSFFNRGDDESESQPICNKGMVSLTDPSPYRIISASRDVNLNVQMFILLDDLELQLSLLEIVWNCSRYEINKSFNCFESTIIKDVNGSTRLYYIVLDHAVEATIEVLLETNHESFLAHGKVIAYYGNLGSYCHPRDDGDDDDMESTLEYRTFKCGPDELDYFKATLFEISKYDDVLSKPGKIMLRRSKLLVPKGGSLVIEVHLMDSRDDKQILGDAFKFQSNVKDCSTGCLEGIGCKLNLKVDWKCVEEEDASSFSCS